MTSSAFQQSLDDPDFVDSIKCIELAHEYKIKITDRFLATKTKADLVEFRDWLYSEIKKKDSEFRG